MSGLDPKDSRLPGMRMWMAGLSLKFVIRVETHSFVNGHTSSITTKYPVFIHGEDWQDCYNQAEKFRDAIVARNHKTQNYTALVQVEALS